MTARERAMTIAEELFRNGFGEEAKRLVLELDDGRDGGGWSKKAAIDRIEAALRAYSKEAVA